MLFNFAFKESPHAMKHRAKGLETRWKRGDGERANKAATKNLSLMMLEMFCPVLLSGCALLLLACPPGKRTQNDS